jgi:hypothetical protein
MAADYCKHSNSKYEVIGGYVVSPERVGFMRFVLESSGLGIRT